MRLPNTLSQHSSVDLIERTYPAIIPSIHIPLNIIPGRSGAKEWKRCDSKNPRLLLVGDFLVLFVMSMIRDSS